jgi:hypothetical protein
LFLGFELWILDYRFNTRPPKPEPTVGVEPTTYSLSARFAAQSMAGKQNNCS